MKGRLEEPGLGRSRRPVWTNITVAATGQASVSGNALVAKNPEVFTYDADGHLTQDGRWLYTWDGENRLVRMSSANTNPAVGPQQWVEFEYDWQGRRISKKVGAAGSGVATNDLRFVYDGWNLVAILNSDFSLFTSFAWGLDLSGTMQGAGGVGGLLWMTVPSGANAGRYFCAYDGNGNVMALVSAADGSVAARYEYGPFGELIRATGPMAKVNPIRFSTKYQDEETGLVYYGYRYYDPGTGRWPNRDPIGELGFETLRGRRARALGAAANLYSFVGNNPINLFDLLGLYEYEWEGNFTDAEKKTIQDSIGRVKDRANVLIKQLDDNIANLKKCPCPAYDDLAKKLEDLKKVLQGMVKETDDPGFNLEMYKKSMPGVDATYLNQVPWYDDELTLNPTWFGPGADAQDSTMFHEITHGQGTVDDDFSNPFNNAHSIEALMHTDKENWTYFKAAKRDADKKCKPAGK